MRLPPTPPARPAHSTTQDHLLKSHYCCTEPTCLGCFVGFATEEELRQHAQQRHSMKMPR